jgi:sec-independent protein translocase protein TatA
MPRREGCNRRQDSFQRALSLKDTAPALIRNDLLRFEGLNMIEGLFQPMHLLLIFGIALLVFGPKKLPELGKGIGDGIRGFKSAMKDDEKPENEKSPSL